MPGVSGSTTVTVTAAVLTSITITPANSSIPEGYKRTTYCDRDVFGRHHQGSHHVRDLGLLAIQRSPTVSNATGSQGLVTGTRRGA